MRFWYRHPRAGRVEIDLEGFSEADYTTTLMVNTGTFYEEEVLRYIDWVSTRWGLRGLFVDVGGHIGNHAVYFGKFLASQVLCVEANPAVLPTLRRNLAANLDDFILAECAAGEREESAVVTYPEENVGMARVVGAAPGAMAGAPTVCVRTLDSIVDEARGRIGAEAAAVSVVKVDVEGMEPAVIRGASETLRRHRPHLFLEAMEKEDRRRLDEILVPLGYRAVAHLGHTPVYHYVHAPSATTRGAVTGYLARARLRRLLRRAGRGWRRLTGASRS